MRGNQHRRDSIHRHTILRFIRLYYEGKPSELRRSVIEEFKSNSFNASVSEFIKELDKHLKDNPYESETFISTDFNDRVEYLNGILKSLQRNWNINKLMDENKNGGD